MNEPAVPESKPSTSTRRPLAPEFIAAAVVAVVLVIFIVQNDEDVKVSWVVFSRRASLWTVILVSAALGYALGQLVEFAFKRRRRSRQQG